MFDTIIDLLPLAVLLYDADGSVILNRGGLAHMFGEMAPSRETGTEVRWEIIGPGGERLDPSLWPDAMALAGRAEGRALAMGFAPDHEPLTTLWVAFPVALSAKKSGGVLLVELYTAESRDDTTARRLLEANLMDAFKSAIQRAAKEGSMLALGLAAGREVRPRDVGPDKEGELTPREKEVLKLIAWGLGNKEIAAELGIGVKTVEFHRAKGIERLGLKGKRDVVRFALARGWLDDC